MKRHILFAAMACGILLDSGSLSAQSSRIAGPIDNGQRVELPESVPAGAQLNSDSAPVDPSVVMRSVSLRFKPSAQQQIALSQLLLAQQDPSSPDYRHWLSPFEFADRFGLSAEDIAAVVRWLQAQGLTLTYTANGRNWLAFSGTAAQLSKVFRTPLRNLQLDGHTHFANTANISIPAALSGVVAGVRGLDDFHPKPAARAVRRFRPDLTRNGTHYLAPGDVAAIYDIDALYNNGIDGTGQSIVIAGQTDIYLADISSFRSTFSLPANLPQLILYGGDPGVSPEDLVEADLDLEWSGAAAPDASIIYVYSSDVFSSVFYAIDQWPILAPVISLSYSGCEPDNRGILDELRSAAQQASAAGITWVAASGDTGAAGCDSETSSRAAGGLAVSVPASIPEVTAVGGAEFDENGGKFWNSSNGSNMASALRYIPETGWNDTVQADVLTASGGGVSMYYPAPSWQIGTGFPNDGFRDVPDVALSASAYHDAYVFCTGGECANGELGLIGGTSVGTPIFAGVLALLNQYLVSEGSILQAGLGNVNASLYQLARTAPFAFHDITTGSNVVPCALGTPNCSTGSYGYYAGPGYDQVTGLGSIDAYNLVVSWASAVSPGQAPAVSTSAASGVTSSGATLACSVNPNGLDTQSWFVYSTNSSLNDSTSTVPQETGAGTFSYTLTGLTGNTAYYYQARASNSAGASTGATLSFTTATPVARGILNLSVSPPAAGVVQPVSGQQFPTGTSVALSAAESVGWTFSGWTGSVANPDSPATSVVVTTGQSVIANFIPQQFTDVTSENIFFDAVNLFQLRGITSGCGGGLYCPNSTVTRAEMAVFIVRSVYGGDNFTLNQQSPYFTDVPEGSFGYNWIQKMFELGITSGCGGGNYCPDSEVSRAEMAAFIIRMRFAGDPFTYSSSAVFTDVPEGASFFSFIQRMAYDGITSGCGSGFYCPDQSVTRAQMAVFVMRGAFNWLVAANTPEIVSVVPNHLTCCTPTTVEINGANTSFAQGVTTLVNTPGITWSDLTVTSPTAFSVVLQGSATRPEPIYVQTGAQEEVLPNALLP